jgi:hypothetical protein
VTHVGGEPGLTFDAVLQVGRHPVERRGELLEVAVVAGIHPGVELAVGDRHGGIGQSGERAQCPGARPAADGGAGQGGHQRGAGQGEGQRTERARQFVEGEDLEVDGVYGWEWHTDDLLGGARQREALGGRGARQHQVPLGRGDGTLAHRDGRGVPLPVGAQHGAGAGQRVDRLDELGDVGGGGAEGVLYEGGIGERLALFRRLAFTQERRAGGEVGDPGHEGRQAEGGHGEREGHPRP